MSQCSTPTIRSSRQWLPLCYPTLGTSSPGSSDGLGGSSGASSGSTSGTGVGKSGCGVSRYGMSDIAGKPLTEFLEAAQRARRPVKAPHDRMGSRLLKRDQAPEAQATAPATRDRPVSDPRVLTFQPSRPPCNRIQGKPSQP